MKTLDSSRNFLAIDKEYSNLEDSKIVIVSAPYEHTVSYGKGASFGPEEILKASAFVEFYDDEFDRELCFDVGITTLEPLDFNNLINEDALFLIEKTVSNLIDLDKFVITLGGEHTISSAPILSHFKKYPDMCLLHFDAHSDLRDSYEGSKYSHASVMARVCEFFPPERIVQVGIRAQCKEEADFIKEKKIKTFYSSAIRRKIHGENWQKQIVNSLGDLIYISFDVDYFDPSIIPATGTPEPDGFLYSETLDIFREINKAGKKIIGFDVVELSKIEGLSHPSLTTARLIYKLLNFAFK
ncbi:MAG: agmatinase [Candidatus Kapabacteria bacterium]|nr:agmatinase [Candidatus Kapabacteria bacterium]